MTKKRAVLAVPLVVLVVVVAVAALLASRGGGADDESSSSDAGGSVAEPAVADDAKAPADEADPARHAVSVTPVSRAVISTGQVTLRTEEMVRARAEIIRMVSAWGGVVADEQSTSDDRGRLVDSTLTLRVPSPRFDDAMTSFDALGRVVERSRSSEDVTTKVVDNDARVRAAERSIRRIEVLLSRAEDLGDVIAIENDLARRQADLDSLKSQQAYLKDQTTLSTVNVYLSRPAGPATGPDEAKGFLAGLSGGWHALGVATVVALTVLGAVLPFAVLLLVLGVPVWLVVRRRGVSGPSAPARTP
jgi:hypothetical protein